MIEFRDIGNNEADLKILGEFIANAGVSLNTFRYFDKRELNVIDQHTKTVLILDDNIPVSYGHLEEENNVTWLGICVSESAFKRGFGNLMMNHLVETSIRLNINELSLKVDEDNVNAISLYRKFGFEVIQHSKGSFYIMRRSNIS